MFFSLSRLNGDKKIDFWQRTSETEVKTQLSYETLSENRQGALLCGGKMEIYVAAANEEGEITTIWMSTNKKAVFELCINFVHSVHKTLKNE